MTNKQFRRLSVFFESSKTERVHIIRRVPSKRQTKANGGGWGQVLKSSRVREQVPLNKIFPAYK